MAKACQPWSVRLVIASVACVAGFGTPDLTLTADRAPTVWPCQLTVTGDLREFAELAWAHSPTFREQCRKLAAAGAIVIVTSDSTKRVLRAETRIWKMRDGVTFARTRVRPTENVVELIAHELEHVIECVEGVRYLLEAGRGNSGVFLTAGAYETHRAIETGHRVAHEVRHASKAP
jgi:hypothetical protein